MPTLRLGDAETAGRYPLAVAGTADWQAVDGGWRLSLSLPDLGAGSLLVPSLALAATAMSPAEKANWRHRWALQADGEQWPLAWVPSSAAAAPSATAPIRPGQQPGERVSSHIDCYRIHRPLRAPRLELQVHGPRPERYLIAVSCRPFTLGVTSTPARAAALARSPPGRSQLSAPPAIAERICSPTCVSMVLDHWRHRHQWLEVVAECLDPATGTYGLWPLATAAAARRGSPGAVEVFADWVEPLTVLEAGIPLVTSIRFGSGELPGAPLAETHGHLVVVTAAGPDGIVVCDPASAPGEVLREYPSEAFSRAWLRQRGAAYILPS